MRRSNGADTPRISAARGRPFAKGNPGRRPGAKNRCTILATALLEGQTEALLRTAIQLASAGDVVMLKFLLGRLLPRERPVTIELPEMAFADDGVEALGSIMRAVSIGAISPDEGAKLAAIVQSFTNAIDTADVVKRLDAIENRLGATARSAEHEFVRLLACRERRSLISSKKSKMIESGNRLLEEPPITPPSWPLSTVTANPKSTSHCLMPVSGALSQLLGRSAVTNSNRS